MEYVAFAGIFAKRPVVLVNKPPFTKYVALAIPPVKLNVAVFILQVGWVIFTERVTGAGLTVTVIADLSLSTPPIV